MKVLSKVWCVALITMVAAAAIAGPEPKCCVYPVLPQNAPVLEGFVPAGWRIELKERGALNGDVRTAVALVLRATNPAFVEKDRGIDTNPRILVVAFENSDGSYELGLQNHTLIPRPLAERDFDYELGDQIERQAQKGLLFKRGSLQININENLYVGPTAAARQTYTFRFRNKHFELIGYDSTGVGYHGWMQVESYNFLTRRMSSSSGTGCVGREEDIQKNCRFKTGWTDLRARPLLNIEEIGSGLEFSPEVK